MADDLQTRLAEHAEQFVLALCPHARREGHALVIDELGGARAYVSGLRAGQVHGEGAALGLVELAQRVKNLEWEEAETFCELWLSNEGEPEPEPVEMEAREPEEINARALARVVEPAAAPRSNGAHGADVSYLPDIHRLLPQAPDAERGVLCAFFNAPQEIGALCAQRGIYAGHFHLPAHATIYGWLLDLYRDHEPIDFITLTQKLRDAGQLDRVGGAAYVTELATAGAVPAYAGHYIEVVERMYARRELIRVCTEHAARGYDALEEDEPELFAGLESKVRGLVDLAAGRRTRLPGLRDASTMLGENLPPSPPELVSGLLHQGSKLIIGGTSKGRKTFSLLDLAISVACGVEWWGFAAVPGRVCYINFEIQEPFFCRRIEDICRAKGVRLPAGMFMGWTLRGHSEGIERMVEELMAVLLRERFVLVIFDPIYKALGNRDENKAGDVASLCNELERIAVRTGAAIAFGAHYSKGNQAAKESIDRIGGSGVFARDPDAILTMTAHEQEECFTVDATLRNFPPLAPFVVKWQWPLFAREEFADPQALKQPKGGQFTAKYTTDMLLAELSVIEGMKPGELKRRMEENQGMTRATFFRLLRELREGKKIETRTGPDGKDLLFRKGRTA